MAPSAGFTALVANRIQDATATLMTGTLKILPTDGNDQPIGTTAGGIGGPIAANFAAPILFSNGILANTGQVADTSLTLNQHISYRFVFQDASGKTFLTWTGVQPSGPSFDLDIYTPLCNATLGIVTGGPQGPPGSLLLNSPVSNAVAFQAPVSFTDLSVNGARRIVIPTVEGWTYALVGNNGHVFWATKPGQTAGLTVATTGGGGGGASTQLATGVATDGTNQTFPGNLTTVGEVFTPTRVPLLPNVAGAATGTLDVTRKYFIVARDAASRPILGASQTPATTTAAIAPAPKYAYDAAAFTAQLNQYIGYGESLYVAPDSSPALSTTPSTTAKMFSTGPNATTLGTTNTLTALVESGVETQSGGFAGMLAARLAPRGLTHPLLVSGAAHSGYTYAQLAGPTTAGGSGTAQFQELMSQISTGKALAPSTYAFRGIFLNLGINDADAGTPMATFQADLLTLQSDIQAGAAAILGNIPPVKIWFEECQYALGLAQAQLCALYPDLFGMYVAGSQIEHHPASEIASIPSIGVHESNYGQRNKGEYAALCVEREVLQASRWVVPHPRSFTVVGNTVQVNYFTDSQIALDTSWMGVRPNNGFAFSDGAGTTITAVAVTGFDQVTITFSRVPSPTGRTLSYGMIDETGAYADGSGPSRQQGPLYGRGGNVRNTSTVTSTFTQRGGAHAPMHLYGSKFSYSI